MTNFTAGHETRTNRLGAARLDYPDRHIEADNRLSFFLGKLNARWGDDAHYVHLSRDRLGVASSFEKRPPWRGNIVTTYRRAILAGKVENVSDLDVCLDYVDTVTANIESFLSDKTHVFRMTLENANSDFDRFWDWIGAEGARDSALAEWNTKYNKTKSNTNVQV